LVARAGGGRSTGQQTNVPASLPVAKRTFRLGRPPRRSNRLTIALSALSLLVASFGLLFSVVRASAEDQSTLRTELTDTIRRLTQVTYGKPSQSNTDERVSIVGQVTQIIGRV